MSEANATAPAAPAAPEPAITVTQVPIPQVPADEGINILEAINILNGGQPAETEEAPAPAAAAKPAKAAAQPEETADDIDDVIAEALGEQPPAAPAAAAAPATAEEIKAEISEIATQYGMDPAILTQFNDVDSAYTAIAMFADQYANIGLDEGGVRQPAPAAPAAPAPPADIELDLDESALDDKSLAAFRTLKQALADERKNRSAIEDKVNALIEVQATAHKRALHATAAAVVDSFNSEKYGTSANRTAAQRLNVQQLYALADNIQIGLEKRGLHIPAIGEVLHLAAAAQGVRPAAKKAAAPAPAPAPAAAAAPAPAPKAPAAPAAPRPIAPATVKLGEHTHLGNLHRDPAFMAGATRILSRPSS